MVSSKPASVFLVCCAIVIAAGPGAAKEKITFTPKQGQPQPAKPESCEMQVFAERKPDRPFIDLGVINYHDERHRTQDGSLKLDVAIPKIKARCVQGRRRRPDRDPGDRGAAARVRDVQRPRGGHPVRGGAQSVEQGRQA